MGDNQVSPFTRKAPYSYGWDWGPRLVTSGIYKKIFLEVFDDIQMEHGYVWTERADEKFALINIEVDVTSETDREVGLKITMDGKLITETSTQKLTQGINHLKFQQGVANPKLWWPLGMGDPYQYHFTIQILDKEEILDETSIKAGIRTAMFVQKKDPTGKGSSFEIQVNGHNVFCRGCNYIPNDSFIPRVSDEKY